jgi:hypothetical protein
METILDPPRPAVTVHQAQAPSKSAASWSAIIAGAFVAVAVSLVLFALGSGLGFASVSTWEAPGAAAKTFAITTAIWFVVMQWLSSAAGGYIAGRLRTRWIGTHAHEVFFRDTAHGFVTWAVATVLVAALLTATVTAALGGGVRAATTVAAGAARSEMGADSPAYAYGMDRLFRRSDVSAAAASGGTDPRAEVAHVVAQAFSTDGNVSEADQSYLADLVAARTGASQEEARKRVNDFIVSANLVRDRAKEATEEARKAAAKTAIFTSLALAVGAFIACLTAALGGKLRDEHP